MKQKLIVGVLILAMIGFLLPNILPLFNSSPKRPAPVHTSGMTDAAPAFKDEGNLYFVRGNDTLASIDIEIADTSPKRQRGLMYREHMDEDHGMLFVFEEAGPQGFWMKNTYIPLDLLFVDAAGKIVYIAEQAPAYSNRNIGTRIPSLYVIEVNAGYCERHGIQVGDQMVWDRG